MSLAIVVHMVMRRMCFLLQRCRASGRILVAIEEWEVVEGHQQISLAVLDV
jgi:hypothetical protein